MGISSGPRLDPAARNSDLPGRVSIEVEAVPVLSWALARHGVPVVSRLLLTGGAVPVRSAEVTVQVRTADGPLGSPAVLRADLAPGRTTVLAAVDLHLDADVLSRIPAARPGVIEVSVAADGTELACSSTPVQVLGAAQWLAAPAPLALAMLAAHVLPDDPAAAALVGGAADLLELRTGDPSLADSTCGPELIDRTVAAIVEAMRRRGVRHSPAPADWARTALTVRTPGEVLESRLGSSLDTAVVLAAALEHAGIRPLLWIAEGHAFLGYWRTPGGTGSTVTTEVDGLVELVERGAVQLVDATMLTAEAEPATFGDLHRTPHAAWLTGDLHRITGVTDVHRARLDGIRPLPVPGADPARRRARQPPARDDGWTRLALTLGTTPPPRVEQWAAELRDLAPNRTAGWLDDSAGPSVLLPRSAADRLQAGTPAP
ncbi:hypothetical protein SAMN05661080_03033 [Modestobacter sp. DSM 44400]|uniref:hypothetical protein n=1 Tax=Modestobacter sp. DSM 44400 TaxID=1550230 RepID=UPI0008952055|nr:hypothetical protein [Modestobacter sp. DSM 44400]SDY30781.1 hypothetical protein SAMN05661080_03033 [Modestobacter sp. DSM 44400]